MKKIEKKPKYTLSYVSICDSGNDFHTYHFTTLKGARKGLKECLDDAKGEFDKGTYSLEKTKDYFAIWEKTNHGNQITASINKYNDDIDIC